MTATQFTPLPEIQRLSPRCIRILGNNPGKFTLQGTNTYLLGSGRNRILIDTGEGKPGWISSLKTALTEEKATVETVLISHWHHDHTGGLSDLLSVAPGAVIYKNEPDAGQFAIAEGQKFTTAGATLTAVHTPGHTKDHMVFVLAEEDAMFTADNVLGHGTAVFEDMSAYLESLAKMQGLFSGKAYPGHGPVIDDGPAKIAEYIKHRQFRIDQVLQTMRASKGSSSQGDVFSVVDLVRIIYHDVAVELHPAASRGILQILEKLTQDGLVMNIDQDGWQLVKGRSTL